MVRNRCLVPSCIVHRLELLRASCNLHSKLGWCAGILDQEEATALLRLEDFQFSECNGLYWRCFLWIAMEGLVFRIIAFLALHFGNRSKKV